MKIGIDFHGVIDIDPETFAEFTQTLLKTGNEVHILTGHPITDELKQKLERWKIGYTTIYSIVDHHRGQGTHMWQDRNGSWWMDPQTWDRSKADYCRKINVDLHIDDSPLYGQHFTTSYLRYQPRKKKNGA